MILVATVNSLNLYVQLDSAATCDKIQQSLPLLFHKKDVSAHEAVESSRKMPRAGHFDSGSRTKLYQRHQFLQR